MSLERLKQIGFALVFSCLIAANGALAADNQTGRLVFSQCLACHSAEAGAAHRIGPNLWDIVGRSIASAEDFEYSEALHGLQGHWNVETLDRFLLDPMSHAPGTKMVFPGVKDDRARADLIDHLHSLSDTPIEPAPRPDTTGNSNPFGDDWPLGPGRELTGYVCGACHSLALVRQQGLTREAWDDLLVWMVEKQGMTEPAPEQRGEILDYLAAHFGVGSAAAVAIAPDDQFGDDWPLGPGRKLTGYTCNACHSLAIVKQQGLSHEDWDELLDWMVEEQGMAEPAPEQRAEILAYLALHFGRDR